MKRYDTKFRSHYVTERMIRVTLTDFFTNQTFLKTNYILTNIKAVINNNIYLLSKQVFVNNLSLSCCILHTNTNLLALIMNGTIIFILSLILNFTLFYSIKIGLFGFNLKDKFITCFKEHGILFIIIPFIVSFLIISYLGYNSILLDGSVKVTVESSDVDFEFNGDFFRLLYTYFGAAGVFTASARLAAGLTAKMSGSLNLIPKIGIIGSTSTGFTATYLLLTNTIPATKIGGVASAKGKIKLIYQIGDNSDTTSTLLQNEGSKSVLSKWLNANGLTKTTHTSEFTSIHSNGLHEFKVNMTSTVQSRVIEELNNTDPNWKDQFIHCPLEKGDLLNSPFIQSIIENITINLVLHFVILYLLVMLVTIFTCKIILENKINLDKTLSYPLGKYIHRFLTLYVNLWSKSANLWIYFILFCLILFNCGILISYYNILSVIN